MADLHDADAGAGIVQQLVPHPLQHLQRSTAGRGDRRQSTVLAADREPSTAPAASDTGTVHS